MVVLSDVFDAILLDKGEVLSDHLRNIFRFLVSSMRKKLDPREADKLSCSNMLAKYPVQSHESLYSCLVVIGVINWYSCVSLPDEECLGNCPALLPAHGTLAPPRRHAL